MDLISPEILLNRYLEAHSAKEDAILNELSRHTYLNEIHPQMISGPIQGALLTLLSSLIQPSRALEIGTFTGYSAICIARGMQAGSKLITLEANDELRETAESFFLKAGVKDRIELINGDALEILPRIEGPLDLVFIDANKEHYPRYYDLIIDKVSVGGYILADNVLWGGKVLDETTGDASTRALQIFNRRITEDPRVENLLLPVRDGLMIAKKQNV